MREYEKEFETMFYSGHSANRPQIFRKNFEFIYFMRLNDNLFKIGKSNNLTYRIQSIRTENRNYYDKIDYMDIFGPLLSNFQIEKDVLKVFQSFYERQRGKEYFIGDPAIASIKFKNLCKELYISNRTKITNDYIEKHKDFFRYKISQDKNWKPNKINFPELSLLDPLLFEFRHDRF